MKTTSFRRKNNRMKAIRGFKLEGDSVETLENHSLECLRKSKLFRNYMVSKSFSTGVNLTNTQLNWTTRTKKQKKIFRSKFQSKSLQNFWRNQSFKSTEKEVLKSETGKNNTKNLLHPKKQSLNLEKILKNDKGYTKVPRNLQNKGDTKSKAKVAQNLRFLRNFNRVSLIKQSIERLSVFGEEMKLGESLRAIDLYKKILSKKVDNSKKSIGIHKAKVKVNLNNLQNMGRSRRRQRKARMTLSECIEKFQLRSLRDRENSIFHRYTISQDQVARTGDDSIRGDEEVDQNEKHIAIKRRGKFKVVNKSNLNTKAFCEELLTNLRKAAEITSPKQIYTELLQFYQPNFILMRLLFSENGKKLSNQSVFMLERCIDWKKFKIAREQKKSTHGTDFFPRRVRLRKRRGPFSKKKSDSYQNLSSGKPRNQYAKLLKRTNSINFKRKNFKPVDFGSYNEVEILNFFRFLDFIRMFYVQHKLEMQKECETNLRRSKIKSKSIFNFLGITQVNSVNDRVQDIFGDTEQDYRMRDFKYKLWKRKLGGVVNISSNDNLFLDKRKDQWEKYVDPEWIQLDSNITKFASRLKLQQV